MKKIILAIALFSFTVVLSACAMVEVVGFDKRANTVTLRGNEFTSEKAVQKRADKYCGGPAVLLSMGEKEAGYYTQGGVQNYGDATYGSSTTVPIVNHVYTFECRKN